MRKHKELPQLHFGRHQGFQTPQTQNRIPASQQDFMRPKEIRDKNTKNLFFNYLVASNLDTTTFNGTKVLESFLNHRRHSIQWQILQIDGETFTYRCTMK